MARNHTVVALLSEDIQTSNLVELSTETTEINDVTWNYENLGSVATEIYLPRFAVDSIQTLYLEHMSPGAITISGSTSCKLCCHGNWELLLLFWHLKDNELHAWQTYSYLGNFIKWFTGHYWNVVTMATEHMLVNLPFEALLVLYLIHRAFKQTAIQDVACCQDSLWLPGQLITIVTRHVADAYHPGEPPYQIWTQ